MRTQEEIKVDIKELLDQEKGLARRLERLEREFKGENGQDIYIEKTIHAIKEAKSDQEIRIIINKIYQDGFIDGIPESN